MRIDSIQPGGPVEGQVFHPRVDPGAARPSFKETFSGFLGEVNAAQKASGEAQRKVLTGEVADIHQAQNKSEEAKVALNMLMELRNKSLSGFDERMRMKT
jgi:flagellar hook-basal body complex protein FliE